MVLNFREWLINENTTAQLLKKYDREMIKFIKSEMEYQLKMHFTNYRSYSDKVKSRLKNMLVYFFIDNLESFGQLTDESIEGWWLHAQRGSQYPNIKEQVKRDISGIFDHALDYGDFISAHVDDNDWLSKINKQYTLVDLDGDSGDWHNELAKKAREGKGAPGRDLGIKADGFHWVSLDKASCDVEGVRAGHCGNTYNPAEGDNIFSLRNEKEQVYATFVVNRKKIKEGKGRFNKTPEPKLFPAIEKLLLSPLINKIEQSGRTVDLTRDINNFHLANMPPAMRNKILAAKPNIDDEEKNFRNQMRALPKILEFVEKGDLDGLAKMSELRHYNRTLRNGCEFAVRVGMEHEINSIYEAGKHVTKKGAWNPVWGDWEVENAEGYLAKILDNITFARFHYDKYSTPLSPGVGDVLDESMVEFHKNLKKYAPWLWEEW